MSRASRSLRLFGMLIKFLLLAAVFSVIGFLIWRVFYSTKVPESVESLTPGDALYAAYEEEGDDLYIFRQKLDMMARADTNAGYFSVEDCRYIPEANQIHILFRYNNSTIRALQKDYGLTEAPDRSEDLFDVTLLLATDLTPQVETDNFGNDPESVAFTRLYPVSVTSDQKFMYNYRRMVFDLGEADLSLSELIENDLLLTVYADVYYTEDVDYSADPYGTLCLYDYTMEKKPVPLSSADKKALREFGGK